MGPRQPRGAWITPVLASTLVSTAGAYVAAVARFAQPLFGLPRAAWMFIGLGVGMPAGVFAVWRLFNGPTRLADQAWRVGLVRSSPPPQRERDSGTAHPMWLGVGISLVGIFLATLADQGPLPVLGFLIAGVGGPYVAMTSGQDWTEVSIWVHGRHLSWDDEPARLLAVFATILVLGGGGIMFAMGLFEKTAAY